MQIVIDINDKVYVLLKYFEEGMGLNDKKDDSDDVKTALMRAVINGTPLPKGHGRLKDVDKLELSCMHSDMECFGDCSRCHDRMVILKDLEDAKTVIEADTNS